MIKPGPLPALSFPDWVLQATAKSGDIPYRWDMHSDQMQWWIHESSFDVSWPDKGHLFMSRIHPLDLPRRMDALKKHLQNTGIYECDFRIRAQGADFVWMHDRGQVNNHEGMCLLGLMRPITERKQAEETKQEALLRDPLTLHLSRRRLREEIERLLLRLQLENRQSGLIAVGFAHEEVLLKSNEKDHLLALLGTALGDCAGPLDHVARLSDSHFALLLDRADPSDITLKSGALRHALATYAHRQGKRADSLSLHIASLLFYGTSNKPDIILSTAEDALTRAYRLGQSDYLASLSESGPSLEKARQTAKLVWDARAKGQLHFLYQPIVAAQSHQVILYESLLRLHSDQGLVANAGSFIPDLELLGDMRWLDRYVLEQATEFLADNPNIYLSINISGLTVGDPSWGRALRLALLAHPSLAKRLMIEITETAAIADLDETIRFVNYVRQLGCRVAIDDFGAGFTSFRQLRGLAVDMVKIDGHFIRDILHNNDHQLFLHHLVSLGKEAGFTTIAEYVETEEQAKLLAEMGIDYLQGFHFGQLRSL